MRLSSILSAAAIAFALSSSACSLVNAPDDVKAGGGAGGAGGSGTTATTGTTGSTTGSTTSSTTTSSTSTTSSTTSSSSTGMDCPTPCGDGQECVGGQCVCTGGLTLCDGACVDTNSDVNNCGLCGKACGMCGACNAGTCDVTPGNPGTQAFTYTGAEQTFVVPDCVFQLKIEAWGAQGGGSQACSPPNQEDGGLGGYAIGTVAVTPGQTLTIMVGGKGGMGPAAASFNGGGPSGQYGGSGGGASDVRIGPNLADRILVAGGGGGGDTGCPDHGTGGPGGGLNGGDGISLQGYPVAGGGSQVAGGAAGQQSSAGQLGLGGGTGAYHESGGGGGYYGGGGAYAAGGGGGSCFIGNAMSASCASGVQTGDGKIVLTW